jgi:hypothetical protein
MPGNIFLNYRRDDTAGHAGRLFDRLNWRFPGRVFRDVTGIDYGLDFTAEIEHKLAACRVLIVLIGKHWLTLKDDEGRRRIDNEDDFVRLEVASGLRRNIRVIPVLVSGAQMPAAADLPPDLQPLAKRNALEITEPDFDNDAQRLIRALEQALGEQPPPPPREPPPRRLWKKLLVAAVVGSVLLGLGVAVVAFFLISLGPSRNDNLNINPYPPVSPSNTPPPRATPSPSASPADAADDFFQPVGRWVIKSGNNPLSIDLTLMPDETYFSLAQGAGSQRKTRGSWVYLGNDRQLVLTGQDEYGNPTADRLEILRVHDGHYHAMYMGVGEVEMWPQ